MRAFMYSESHLSDQDLVLAADGELVRSRAAEVARHLERCWPCRARKQELGDAVVNFVRHYRAELDPSLPPPAGPKALLRAHLNQAAATVRWPWWTRWRHMFDWRDATTPTSTVEGFGPAWSWRWRSSNRSFTQKEIL